MFLKRSLEKWPWQNKSNLAPFLQNFKQQIALETCVPWIECTPRIDLQKKASFHLLVVLDQCYPWEVIIEPVVELHAASLHCTVQCRVESTEDQSCVSRCCVVSGSGTSTEKSHGRYLAKFDSFQYSVDSCQLSVFWRFALNFRLWLLWSLHSGSRWPSLWYATSLQATFFSRASTKPQLVILC